MIITRRRHCHFWVPYICCIENWLKHFWVCFWHFTGADATYELLVCCLGNWLEQTPLLGALLFVLPIYWSRRPFWVPFCWIGNLLEQTPLLIAFFVVHIDNLLEQTWLPECLLGFIIDNLLEQTPPLDALLVVLAINWNRWHVWMSLFCYTDISLEQTPLLSALFCFIDNLLEQTSLLSA